MRNTWKRGEQMKTKTKNSKTPPAQSGTNSKPGEHYERRDYGVVRVQAPREGVKIEQLMESAKPEKKKNDR